MTCDFLRAIDAVIRTDPGAPGLEGVMSIVVRHESYDEYWAGVFSKHRAESRFLDHVRRDTRVLWLLSAGEAEAILAGELDGTPGEMVGDVGLIDGFRRRYLEPTSLVDVRASASSATPGRRRRRNRS